MDGRMQTYFPTFLILWEYLETLSYTKNYIVCTYVVIFVLHKIILQWQFHIEVRLLCFRTLKIVLVGKILQINFLIIPPFQSHHILISNFWIFKRSRKLHLSIAFETKVLIISRRNPKYNTLHSVTAPISLCISKCKSRIK